MKTTLTLIAITLLAGCGGYTERTSGVMEETTLILRGESLVGLTVSIDSGFKAVIGEDDLSDYRMGILGVANSEAEDLETVTYKVNSGPNRVVVSSGSAVYVDKTLQFSEGQTRELRIRR